MRVNQVLYAQSLQQLARHPRAVRLGPVSQVAIIRAFASLEALRNATDAELGGLKKAVQESAIAARNLLNESGTNQFEESAARLIEQHDDANIRIAVIGDGDYPEILATAVDLSSTGGAPLLESLTRAQLSSELVSRRHSVSKWLSGFHDTSLPPAWPS